MATLGDIKAATAAWGTTTSASPGTVNITTPPPRDHLAEARAQAKGFTAARHRLADKIRSIGTLYGEAARHALQQPFEDLCAQHDLQAVSFEEAVDAAARKITSAQRHLEVEEANYGRRIDGLRADNVAMAVLLAEAVADAHRRHARNGGRSQLPAWVAQAVEYVGDSTKADRS